jgi:hypothetical protein
MGADDDIASGQSTFMIELSRMKRMMSMATSRSLLIVDELGMLPFSFVFHRYYLFVYFSKYIHFQFFVVNIY